jgi:hypothetical protein
VQGKKVEKTSPGSRVRARQKAEPDILRENKTSEEY